MVKGDQQALTAFDFGFTDTKRYYGIAQTIWRWFKCYLASVVGILVSFDRTLQKLSITNDQTMKKAVMLSDRYRRISVGSQKLLLKSQTIQQYICSWTL